MHRLYITSEHTFSFFKHYRAHVRTAPRQLMVKVNQYTVIHNVTFGFRTATRNIFHVQSQQWNHCKHLKDDLKLETGPEKAEKP